MKKIINIILVFLLCGINIHGVNVSSHAHNEKIKDKKDKKDKKQKSRMLFSWKTKRFYEEEKIEDKIEEPKEEIVDVVLPTLQNIPLVAYSNSMCYMDGRLTTYVNSPAYYWTRQMCSVNYSNGHFMYGDYYAVAMASSFGQCGDKFVITTDTGNVFKVIKTEQKKESELINSQQHPDGSIIEFVIDTSVASTIYPMENGYVLGGNFNRLEHFNGSIIKIEKEV